jgi:hypothetical protein
MTENNEVNLDTLSPTAKQALDNLAKQGLTPGPKADANFNEDGELKDAPAPEKKGEEKKPDVVPPKEDKKPEEGEDDKAPEGDKKPEREIKYVPAWKLKTAEGQKEATEKKLQEALAKIDELGRKPDLTTKDKDNLGDAIDELAKKYPDVDPNLLKDLQQTILSKISTPKEVQEALKEIQSIKEERNSIVEEQEYLKDFDKSVLPLIKAEHPNISEDALLQIKNDLKTYAYTEEYAKVSLDKIFKAEKESLKIPATVDRKKTTENGGSFKTRSAETVDFDNMTEEAFNNLSPEQKLDFAKSKRGSSNWR